MIFRLHYILIFTFLAAGFFLSADNLQASAYPPALPPMGFLTNVDIPDKEYLIVGQYTGKEKTGEIHVVTTYITKDVIKIYSFQWIFNNKDQPLPHHYTNYNYIFTIDLSTGQMLKYFYDDTDYFVTRDKNKGAFFEDCSYSNKTMSSIMKFWDGDDIREKKFEFKDVDPDYPFWHYMPFLLIGARIYDWRKPGVVNIWQEYVKDPFLANFKIDRKNVLIDTPVGKISTTEVEPVIQDPVLAGILKQFTESMKLWYEEGPKRRWIKFHIDVGDQTWLLEKYDTWK